MVLEGYFYCCSLVGADICKDIGFIVGISLEGGWVALSAVMEKLLLQPCCLECLVHCGGHNPFQPDSHIFRLIQILINLPFLSKSHKFFNNIF